jgi:tetratricopeptide (TPR) repeat protein
MQKIGRFGVLIFLIFMFLFQLTSTGQNKKYFIITGKIVPEVATSQIGIIEMSKSGAPITKITIPKNGRFRLELEYFNEYTLTFVLSEHFSKTIIVSTEIPQEVWERDNDFPPFPMVVQLFKEIEGIDKSFTLKASGKIFYGKQTDNFEKESYFSDVQMAEQIETAKAQTSQVAKEAEGITKQEAQDLVVKQKNFDQLIKDADVLYQRGEYQLALIKYLEAKQLFPERAYASDRIAELQDLVKALEITERQRAELDQKYKDAIVRANGFFEQKTYVSARPVYEDALQYKPGDVFANGRIQEIDQLLALLEKQKQFNDLIAQADNSYKSKNFDQAVTLYNQAKQLVPENEYPQTQIDLINQEKEQLGKLEQDKETRFIELQANAEKEVVSLNYDESIRLLNDALKIKPRDASVQKRIDDIQGLKKQQAVRENFEVAIQSGDQQKAQQNYDRAISFYRDALKILPNNEIALGKISEVEQLLAKEKQAKQIEENYLSVISKADKSFNSEDYADSRKLYSEALIIKPNEAYPGERIGKIDEILAEKTKLQQIETEFLAFVSKGDASFSQKEYESARTSFTSALDLKPNSAEVKTKIKNIDDILLKLADEKRKEEERLIALASANNQAFSQAMANADKAFSENDFNTAKSGYEKALAIKVADPVAKQKLGQAEAQLAQLAKMTQAYNTAINVANKHVGDKRYQEAKEKYQEALQYLPDSDYPKQQIVKLDELLAQADAERQKEELFAANIQEGETLFRNKEYAGARVSFVKANELKPSETLPVSRIQEIDKLLAELARIEAKNKATETGYQETIAKADKALAGKEYSSARLFYGEALAIKANEQYPKDKIAEIDQIMADLKIMQYNQAIAAGDLAFKADQLDVATTQYENALTVKANDQYAKNQLSEIAKRRTALQEEQNRLKKLNEQYASVMAAAIADFRNKEYQSAKGKYQDALKLKPEETLPKEQIAKIDLLLQELLTAEETNRLYTEKVNAGQEAFRQNKLKEARDAFMIARDLKPSELLPPIRIAEINTMIAQLEETARLAALEEAQRLAREKANKEQYDKELAVADKAFAEREYKAARTYYSNALSVLPNEKYPKDQISKIDELIAKQMEISMLAQQKAMRDSLMKVRDEAFNRAIASGKEMEQSKQYQLAIQRYNEAITIKPDERSNVQKMITALEDQLRAMDSQNKQYQVSIEKADQLFGASKLEEAIAEYRNASGIKPMEEYPKKQIIDIQNIIIQRNTAYDLAIKNGDNAFNKSDWQNSKAAYTEALLVKPNEAYPEKRLREIDQKIIEEKLAGINSSAENAAYNEAVAKAEKALADKELTTAKMHFNVAHSLKPAETMPPQRIKEIDVLIEQRNKERLAQAQRDTDEKYRQSISVADNAFREKTYTIARLRYQEAQLIKPDETYPKNQIALIDKLLNEAKPVETYAFDLPEIQTAPPVSANAPKTEESAQATEARAQSFRTVENYDEAIRKADDSFGIKDYTVARFYYYKAIEIKPKEEYPVNQIELIRKLVDSELSSIDRSGYDKAIAQADEAFSKQNYTIAKFYYYKALEIKSWEKYPKDRIAEILALTNSLLSEREEKEYRDIIAKADEAYFNKDIAIARFYYNKAIAMKRDENYPRIKLKDIQKLIDQDARDQKNIEYNNVIELADQALQAENFSIARFNYNKALGMKPNEKYPKDQLKRIREALDKQNKQ